jgi:hypothetical protein
LSECPDNACASATKKRGTEEEMPLNVVCRVLRVLRGFLLSCFLPLFGKLFFAFFSVNEHVIWVSEVFFPFLPDFAEAVPILKLDCFKGFKEFLVAFGLQLLDETRQEFAGF